MTSSERRVHAALTASTLTGTALHSLNLPEHSYKLTAELDFVVVTEAMVLAVEVKGGHVSCRSGLWEYSDRAGHHRVSREGPFAQVASGMYALKNRLVGALGNRAIESTAFGFLVVTPDVDLPPSVEWAAETYCGRGPFSRGIDPVLRRAEAYWRAKQPTARDLDGGSRQKLIQTLRPDFDRSPLLDARAEYLDAAFLRLTEEQFSRLDLISDADRILCTGGAGTGKTLLAAEIARRLTMAGNSVLFTCRSETFAEHVRTMLGGTGVDVRSRSELPTLQRHDVVVVDEAQDLMNFASLDLLDECVVGGLAAGRWVMFLDQNRQAHLYDDFDADALQYVRSLGAVPAALKTNCRNTREIAFQTRALTGADTGVAAAGSGPDVEFETVADLDAEAAALSAHLRVLREHDVPARDITIVSVRGDWATSAASATRDARKGRIRLIGDAADASDGEHITWASVVDYKGLENRFVCVIDIDSLDNDREIDLLYVALSRPRAGLWVAINERISARVKDLYRMHAPAALDALRKEP